MMLKPCAPRSRPWALSAPGLHCKASCACSRPRRAAVTAASRKKGGSGKGSSGGRGSPKDFDRQIKVARETQLQASELLAKLLQTSDPKAVAQAHLASLDEQFFHIANTYMQMAQKEGSTDVYNQIKEALIAAMEVKQATLRPEIRLLNKLLSAEGAEAWRGVLAGEEVQEQLTMNDGYFFQLLDRMVADVSRQPDNPQKAQLQQKLAGIREEAAARRDGK